MHSSRFCSNYIVQSDVVLCDVSNKLHATAPKHHIHVHIMLVIENCLGLI